jgi:hypothetical protein
MNLKEAAGKLGVSTVTARRWIKAGRLEAMVEPGRFGQEYTITAGAVDKARNTNNVPTAITGIETTIQTAELKSLIAETIQATVGSLMQGIADDSNRKTLEEMRAIMDETQAYMTSIQQKLDILTAKKQATWWTRAKRWLAGMLVK